MNFTTLEDAAAFTGKLICRERNSPSDLRKREPTTAEALEALSWLLDETVQGAGADKPRRVEAELAAYHSTEHMPPEDGVREGNRNYRFRREIRAVRALCEASSRLVVDALEAAAGLRSRLLAAALGGHADDLGADLIGLVGYVREVIDLWKPTVDRREYNGHMAGAMGRRRARAAHLRWCGRIFAATCTMVWPRGADEWCSEIRSVFDQDLEQFAVTFVMDGQPTYRRVELNPHQFPGMKKHLVIVLKARRLRGNTQKA